MYFKSICVVVLFLIAGVSTAATSLQQDRPGAVSTRVDSETLRCMQCHDGVSAGDVEITLPGANSGVSGLHTGKHPIGMNYRDYVRATPLEYQRHDGLNSNIRLVDGRVSCVSCHTGKQESLQPILTSQTALNEDTVCLSSGGAKREPGGLCQSCHIK